MRMMRPRVMPFLFYALFFFSGSAGLGYQMVWSKMLATGLGHEMRSAGRRRRGHGRNGDRRVDA